MVKAINVIFLLSILAILSLSSVSATCDGLNSKHFCQPSEPICPEGSFYAGDDPIAYANEWVDKSRVRNPSMALGVEDGSFANIKDDGYLIVDMGEGEEIVDHFSFNFGDFSIFGDNTGEWVHVYVSDRPDEGFRYIQSVWSKGEKDVYVGLSGYETIRYIKLENTHSWKWVEIDAIKGKCIVEQEVEEVPEFGTIAAALVLLGAGVFIAGRRKFQ